jgi:hypothetical protein
VRITFQAVVTIPPILAQTAVNTPTRKFHVLTTTLRTAVTEAATATWMAFHTACTIARNRSEWL